MLITLYPLRQEYDRHCFGKVRCIKIDGSVYTQIDARARLNANDIDFTCLSVKLETSVQRSFMRPVDSIIKASRPTFTTARDCVAPCLYFSGVMRTYHLRRQLRLYLRRRDVAPRRKLRRDKNRCVSTPDVTSVVRVILRPGSISY